MDSPLEVALYFAILVGMFFYLPTPAQATTFSCTFARRAEPLVFDLSNVTMQSIFYKCGAAQKLSLHGASTFNSKGLTNDLIRWLLGKELEMCLVIENADIEQLIFTGGYIKGNCEGPKLIIVNNPFLKTIRIDPPVAESLKSLPKSIRIRGNRMMVEQNLNNLKKQQRRMNCDWDLQELGECSLPSPFVSFQQLDRNCSSFYGRLILEQGATQIEYDSSMAGMINIEGCVQIENTKITDVSFLMAFSSFRPIPFCEQFVRNNENLCTKNLNYLNVFFRSIKFSNNLDPSCGTCIGGHVSELYLYESANCTSVYGDLIISDFRELPLNIGNLRGIQVIEGRLIIKNNTGLGVFDYLVSLERIVLRNESETAVIVRDNADLKLLLMPKLVDVDLKHGGRRVELSNNPLLNEGFEKKRLKQTFAVTKNARVKDYSQLGAALDRKRRIANPNMYTLLGLLGGALAAVLLISVAITRRILARQSKNLGPGFLKKPHKLRRKSLEQLTSLCKEIVTRNPMIWSAKGCFVQDQNKATDCSSTRSNHAEFVRSHLVALANNGQLPQRQKAQHNKHIQNRAQEILNYDTVIVLGIDNDITKVFPCIPSIVGDIFAYTDDAAGWSILYKLLEVTQLSVKSTYYKYEAKYGSKQKERKRIEFFLYSWPKERLPTDFSEVLDLVATSNSKKVICLSNRRKEVFSMLHLLYAIVLSAQGPQSAVEAFQLHAEFCNGAPLDRHEILYTMRVLLGWASSNNCLPEEVRKWCHVYDCMANYSKKHLNVISLHPKLLPHLERCEEIQIEMEATRKGTINLSERPFLPLADPFRRKTSKEIEQEILKKTSYGIGISRMLDDREELVTPPEEPSSTSARGARSLQSWSCSQSSQSQSGMFLSGLQVQGAEKFFKKESLEVRDKTTK